jgi:hypothetical protein
MNFVIAFSEIKRNITSDLHNNRQVRMYWQLYAQLARETKPSLAHLHPPPIEYSAVATERNPTDSTMWTAAHGS